MARQTLLPGVGAVHETGTRQTQLPGAGSFSDTVVVGGGIVEGTGAAAGICSVTALGDTIIAEVASAAGAGVASANSATIITTTYTGSAVKGIGIATGFSAVVLGGVGSSVSSGVATGISETGAAPTEGTGAAVGTSTVNGIGATLTRVEGTGVAAGLCSVTALGNIIVACTATAVGVSTVNGIPALETFTEGVGSAVGTATANGLSQSFTGAVAHAIGDSGTDFTSGVVAGVVFSASGTATVLGQSPPSLVPGNFKPIEQRRVRFPKLPRGIPVEQWIDISTREFDSFFNDMHHYLAANTFVSGVHTEILEESFTLTPETSIIFVMSSEAVTSSGAVAIKSVTNIPRIFMIVNTGLFPVTLKDGANTVLAGGDMTLQSGRLAMMIYTGAAWVGNAI